jgi:kinesin family protein 3/17
MLDENSRSLEALKNNSSEAIKVAFRLRPLNDREKQAGRKVCCAAHEDEGVIVLESKEYSKQFTFDAVFSETSTQRRIYDVAAAPVVESVLDGYNGTVFAYGQTGAGKSYTMEGSIIPNTFEHIFDHIALNSAKDRYLVHASYYEIYNEEIRDLLVATATNKSQTSLELRESNGGVYVQGLTTKVVKSVDEINSVLQDGKKNRSVGSTLMNSQSSRSHSIFSIVVECSSTDDYGNENIRAGKLNLVDLAGSERQSKTGATGERLKEATKINLSLSALGNVISALSDGKQHHVPYRDSKLTRILQDSLGGNTKTVMLANAGPADSNVDESLSTLRYANRAKNIKNKPLINQDPKDALLRGYQEEIAQLRKQLAQMSSSSNVETQSPQLKASSGGGTSLQRKLEEEQKARLNSENDRIELQKKLEDMEARLMVGGEIVSNAAKHEAALRKANQELVAKQENDLLLQRKLNEQAEEKLDLEEKYNDVNEEVAKKTKKLKKIYLKYQHAKSEMKDLEEEVSRLKLAGADTIRDLSKQMKLKEFIIDSVIPPHLQSVYEERAIYDENEETWFIPGLVNNRSGRNQLRRRSARRPETKFGRDMKIVDSNPRWRSEDVVDLNIAMPEKTISARDDPNTPDVIAAILAIDMGDDVEEFVPTKSRMNRRKKLLQADVSIYFQYVQLHTLLNLTVIPLSMLLFIEFL